MITSNFIPSFYWVQTAAVGVSAAANLTTTANGSVALVGMDNLVKGSLGTDATVKFRLCFKKKNGNIEFSKPFGINDIISKTYTATAAAAEQITLIGSDGTTITGIGTQTAGAVNSFDITFDYTQGTYEMPFLSTISTVIVTGDTQKTQSAKLVAAINTTLARQFKTAPVLAEIVADGTYDADVSGFAVSNGGYTLTKTTHGITIADGATIRVDTATTGVNSPVYTVASSTVNTIVLTTPYTGATTSAAKVGAATVEPTNYALKLTGISRTFDDFKQDYRKVRFTIQPKSNTTGISYPSNISLNFPTSLVVKTTQSAYEGIGTYNQVAENEIITNFKVRDAITPEYPTYTVNREADNSSYYMINLVLKDDSTNQYATGQKPVSVFSYTIAVKSGISTSAPDIKAALGL